MNFFFENNNVNDDVFISNDFDNFNLHEFESKKTIDNFNNDKYFFHQFELKKTIDNINKNNFVRRAFEIKKNDNDDENVDNNFIISFNRTRRLNISNFNRFRIELKY